MSTHTAAADPHPQYLTAAEAAAAHAPLSHTHTAAQISDASATGRSLITAADAAAGRTALGAEPSGTAASTMSTHVAAADPHPQYLTPAEGNAAYAAAGHTHTTFHNLSLTGTTATQALSVTGTITATGEITGLSDARLKTIERDVTLDMAAITSLGLVDYAMPSFGTRSTGVIAQRLVEVLPRLVHEDPASGLLSVDYGKTGTAVALSLAQHLAAAIAQISDLSARLAAIEGRDPT